MSFAENTGKKYQRLSDKIDHLQNIQLNSPKKSAAIEYDLEKVNESMEKSIRDYNDKTDYLKKEIGLLKNNFTTKQQMKDLTVKQAKKEYDNAEYQIGQMVEEHKEQMKKFINESFESFEKDIIGLMNKKKQGRENLLSKFEKLKSIIEVQIPALSEDNEMLNKESKENLLGLEQMVKEEVVYATNLVTFIILLLA